MSAEIVPLAPFELRAKDLLKQAESLTINEQADIAKANALFKQCQETLKEIKDEKEQMIAPVEDRIKQIKVLADMVGFPIREAKTLIEAKALAYKAEIERLRQEEAEAERKRLEALRLEQEAKEQARLAEEKRIRDEEEARLADIRAAQEIERAKLETEQNELRKKEREIEQRRLDEEAELAAKKIEIERQQRENEAERVRLAEQKAEEERKKDAEIQAKALATEAAETKLRGETTYWTFEVMDVTKLNPFFLKPDEAKINEEIKNGTREIAGLRIYSYTKMK
jgi:hypothetical protein